MRQHTDTARRSAEDGPSNATASSQSRPKSTRQGQHQNWDEAQDNWPDKPATRDDVKDMGILESIGRAVSQPVRDAADESADEQLIKKAADDSR